MAKDKDNKKANKGKGGNHAENRNQGPEGQNKNQQGAENKAGRQQ